jgi:hypothetical protein
LNCAVPLISSPLTKISYNPPIADKAGHNPSQVIRHSGDIFGLKPTGPLVGVMEDVEHCAEVLELGLGDA